MDGGGGVEGGNGGCFDTLARTGWRALRPGGGPRARRIDRRFGRGGGVSCGNRRGSEENNTGDVRRNMGGVATARLCKNEDRFGRGLGGGSGETSEDAKLRSWGRSGMGRFRDELG